MGISVVGEVAPAFAGDLPQGLIRTCEAVTAHSRRSPPPQSPLWVMPLHPAPQYNCRRGSQRPIQALYHGFAHPRRREVTSEMVKVSIEVRSGAARFDVAVWAESVERAVDVVRRSYPAYDAAVKFPIDPEYFRGGSRRPGRTSRFRPVRRTRRFAKMRDS